MKVALLLLLVALALQSQAGRAELRIFVGDFDGLWSFLNLTLPIGSSGVSVPLAGATEPGGVQLNALDCETVAQGVQGCQAVQCYRFDLTYLLPNGIGSRVRMTRSRGNLVGVPLFITEEKGIEWRP